MKMHPGDICILETIDYFFLYTETVEIQHIMSLKNINILEKAVEYYKIMDTMPSYHLTGIYAGQYFERLPQIIKNTGMTPGALSIKLQTIIEGHYADDYLRSSMIESVDRDTTPRNFNDRPYIERTRDALAQNVRSQIAKEKEDLKTSVDPFNGFANEDTLYNLNEQEAATPTLDKYFSSNMEEEKIHYVLYNIHYNISIIVQETPKMMELFLKQFNHFKLIFKIKKDSAANLKHAEDFFHKKTWDREEEVNNMATSFCTLYKQNIYGEKPSYSEKDTVKNILDSLYTINNNPNNRIKAVQLYETVGKILSAKVIDKSTANWKESAINKRLAKYFVDFGLTRNRYTDGIYYYGLEPKEQSKLPSAADSNVIEQLKELRGYDVNIKSEPVK